jgi:hypothetical protein
MTENRKIPKNGLETPDPDQKTIKTENARDSRFGDTPGEINAKYRFSGDDLETFVLERVLKET